MKTSIQTNCCETPKYPGLFISRDTDMILLMTNSTTGTVIHNPSPSNCIGDFCGSWSASTFKPFKGKLTMQN